MKKISFKEIVRRLPKKPEKHLIKNAFLLGGATLLFIGGALFIWLATIQIPDFKTFDERKVAKSTKIYDRTGQIPLYDIHENVKRTVIPLEEMGQNIKNATIAIEDADFYQHNGIRIKSIIRAIFANITSVKISQGGSTISQQVVKRTLLSDEQTYTRKIREAILTLKLEKALTKDEILAIYLNEAPYGGTVYGVQEASKMYFNKNAKDLTLAESAYLAAITKGPSYYSPYGKHRSELESRKDTVLIKMKEQGYITDEEYTTARAEKVTFQPDQQTGIKAPHFVFFIKQYLEEKYGVDMVASGGLKVTTTLDYDLQQKAEKAITDHITQIQKDYNGSNAALVAIDPKTGQILAMVGSRNYFDKAIDGNFNVATAQRQPGSSFKPFVYATAFEKGYTPETVLFDVRTEFNASCDPSATSTKATCYNPDNFDNAFRGPMMLRDALAQSINIPAIKLLYLVGVKDALKTARDMGIKSLTDSSRYGLTLVIGGGEVSLLDMTTAYGTFADTGTYHPNKGILKVEDDHGTVLEEYEDQGTTALPANVALTISDVLSDNNARIPTFGANSPLVVPGYDVAAKTGTTNNNKDAWTMGYSPNLAVGVWVGNNDNTPMKKGGSALAGPIWNQFMRSALPKFENTSFEAPAPIQSGDKPVFRGIWQGGESFVIDTISGKLATDATPSETRKEIAITNVHDILYWVDKDNPTGPAPSNPRNDSQFTNWETAVQRWWSSHSQNYPVVTASQKPTSYDDIHIVGQNPILTILTPLPGSIIPLNGSTMVSVSVSGPRPITRYDYFINNEFIGTSINPFFTLTSDELHSVGEKELRVVVYDTVYNQGESRSTFSVQ